MNNSLSLWVTLSTVLWATGATYAQGGIYRGPGNVVPPSLVPGGGGAVPVAARVGILPDLTWWQFWWEFNKERFLYRRPGGKPVGGAGVGVGARATAKGISDKILPALVKALEKTESPFIQAACLLALAKIARKIERPRLRKLFVASLASRAQRVRETAALALGVATMTEAVLDLEALVHDTPRGHKLTGSAVVDERTRAFVCYSLGLIADRSPDLYVKRRVFKALHKVLKGERSKSSFDIDVAAICGISILNISKQESIVGNRELLEDVLEGLDEVHASSTLSADVRSHIPSAIAKLIGRGSSKVHERYKAALLRTLQEKPTGNQAHRAAALALGQLAQPAEVNAEDLKISTGLYDHSKNGKDWQSRYLALIALGQIGGKQNRDYLLKVLTTGKKVFERPWAAMALGEMEFRRRSANPQAGPDLEVGELLVAQLDRIRAPRSRSAMAVALGLCGYQAAAPVLKSLMVEKRHQDEFCGYMSIGLALLGDPAATAKIREIAGLATRRPQLYQQLVTALGTLRDRGATKMLTGVLESRVSNLRQYSAAAAALSVIDDPEVIPALIKILGNHSCSALSRAFAAASLGGIADPEPLPFHWKIGRNVHYRAAVRTLVSQGAGLLELL